MTAKGIQIGDRVFRRLPHGDMPPGVVGGLVQVSGPDGGWDSYAYVVEKIGAGDFGSPIPLAELRHAEDGEAAA